MPSTSSKTAGRRWVGGAGRLLVAEAPRFRPAEILAALEARDVAYVLIGGLAAALHGAANVTTDVDITPEPGGANLTRLSAALRDLDARVRVETSEGATVAFSHDAASLARAATWNLSTRAGDLDISFVPSGTQGFVDLRRDAVTITIQGVHVPVASLADVVRSKEAADREKDRLVLPILRRLLEGET
jgi:hypothetical protein